MQGGHHGIVLRFCALLPFHLWHQVALPACPSGLFLFSFSPQQEWRWLIIPSAKDGQTAIEAQYFSQFQSRHRLPPPLRMVLRYQHSLRQSALSAALPISSSLGSGAGFFLSTDNARSVATSLAALCGGSVRPSMALQSPPPSHTRPITLLADF